MSAIGKSCKTCKHAEPIEVRAEFDGLTIVRCVAPLPAALPIWVRKLEDGNLMWPGDSLDCRAYQPSVATPLTEGWGWPKRAQRGHYYTTADGPSVCGKFPAAPELFELKFNAARTCMPCWRKSPEGKAAIEKCKEFLSG
ncbi:MAG: hypothetical protein WC718_15245 [Phycisphaerales bacterium]|jgi:hypothetical protein